MYPNDIPAPKKENNLNNISKQISIMEESINLEDLNVRKKTSTSLIFSKKEIGIKIKNSNFKKIFV